MNKPAHTPGPWEVVGSRICTVANDNERITLAKTEPGGAFAMSEQQDANARLIAAAPELLEALKAASEWLNDMGCEHEQPDLRCVVCLVNVAINKAEGREG